MYLSTHPVGSPISLLRFTGYSFVSPSNLSAENELRHEASPQTTTSSSARNLEPPVRAQSAPQLDFEGFDVDESPEEPFQMDRSFPVYLHEHHIMSFVASSRFLNYMCIITQDHVLPEVQITQPANIVDNIVINPRSRRKTFTNLIITKKRQLGLIYRPQVSLPNQVYVFNNDEYVAVDEAKTAAWCQRNLQTLLNEAQITGQPRSRVTEPKFRKPNVAQLGFSRTGRSHAFNTVAYIPPPETRTRSGRISKPPSRYYLR